MNLLSVESITKRYGERLLFKDVSFGLQKGQKTAFVAKNGTGKTTLLKVLAGIEGPEEGKVTFRNNIRVGFLEQEPQVDATKTILENILLSNDPKLSLLLKYETAISQNNTQAIEQLIPEMDNQKLWDAEAQIKQILGILNLHDVERVAQNLSGGEQKRITIAKFIFTQPDLLILDEPTNHLDLDMVEWLEQYLSNANTTLLMVTHDRYFLENVCNNIMELDQEQAFFYEGNFSYYLEKKAERESGLAANIEKAKNIFRKELEWMRSTPQARTTKSKARIDAFKDVKAQAKRRIEDNKVSIDFRSERLGNKIVELHNVSKSYAENVLFKNFSYKFLKGEKVGIAGKNGAGKSTLIKVITEQLKPDTGKVIIGETVSIGHYHQEGLNFKADQRVIDTLREIAEVAKEKDGKIIEVEKLLEKFLFNRKDQQKLVSTLSGGEKRRLYLVTVLMQNPNFLILDEPTNDLDILTLSILEDYLQNFDGCVLLVTHDRYLLDKVADHTFVFEGEGKIKDHVGFYSEYREIRKKELEAQKAISSAERAKEKLDTTPAPTSQKPKTKLSFKEKYEFEQLDEEIPKLETHKEELTEKLSSGNISPDEMQAISTELTALIALLDEKSMRWMELAELYES